MCVMSMVMDHYWDKWRPPTWPYVPPLDTEAWKLIPVPPAPKITSEEVEEFRRLLERAREYDRQNNQPDCELAEKKERIKKLADQLGVKIDFL